ncbi:DNA-binding response regulator [Actinoplanes ianthinogenes]|uniref:DNA-binding response regulator n=1 Tax=Actinoplanes ianthinogenes TaxID=122358 RepID=A0ABM7LN64_9ACTN|nr:response regulator transcription factor [Actinoplanes ianthinogenes]BCJ40718.1 DNA-binding response regulator [Actinoplanes ianthinogenes]GGR43395.1 DNA-binding response regulator [Actinoplanes ianthinogenes]
MIRLVLADDEDLIRGALAALLTLEPDLTVVGEAADSERAVEVAMRTRPDLAVLDLEMPPGDGLQAATAIRARLGIPVVLVTRHARPAVLRRALAAGIGGFVPKTTPAARLAEIIRAVHGGGRYVDPEIAASALSENDCPLTARELEILAVVRGGAPIAEIAAALHLAPGTVRNYLSVVMGKLGADTRHAAAHRAWVEGWI